MRTIHYGDNLDILRRHIPDDSVDLVYLDPPFNSRRDYNYTAETGAGRAPGAGIKAFEDVWGWNLETETAYEGLLRQPHAGLARSMAALQEMLRRNETMAYLVMMAERLLELRRVLKPTGSLYLHCDGGASHYLKILLDALYGQGNFRNEIIWHYYNKYSAGKRIFPRSFDQILFYSAGDRYLFNPLREPRERPIRQLLRENVGGVLKNKKDRSGKTMTRWVVDRKVDAVWRMPCLQYASPEYLGFPTQKPMALLERIVQASSQPGQVVLDPFCGCGTTLHAAEKLGRHWIGIDSAHLAIGLARHRLASAYPQLHIDTRGLPGDLQGARRLAAENPREYRHWACWLVGGFPHREEREDEHGVSHGIDAFRDGADRKVLISIADGEKNGVKPIRALQKEMEREDAAIGLFVTLARPTAPMRKAADGAGWYPTGSRQDPIPRLQLLTVEGLMNGCEAPRFPAPSRVGGATAADSTGR